MKKITVIFLLFTLIQVVNAQDAEKKSAIELKEKAAEIYRDVEITIDNQTFDYRILKHYTEDELNKLPTSKRKQIHFIYTESFTVLNIDQCPYLTIKDIDVAKIEIYRKQNETAIVEYGNECKIQVYLMSKNELQQIINNIR